MTLKEIISVCCENHMKHINTLSGQNSKFSMLKRMVHIVTTVNWSTNRPRGDLYKSQSSSLPLACTLLPATQVCSCCFHVLPLEAFPALELKPEPWLPWPITRCIGRSASGRLRSLGSQEVSAPQESKLEALFAFAMQLYNTNSRTGCK
jgi:hypothetical protein